MIETDCGRKIESSECFGIPLPVDKLLAGVVEPESCSLTGTDLTYCVKVPGHSLP